MDAEEMSWAETVRLSVNEWSTTTERAEQDKQFIVGPSALGFCSERLRRLLDRQEPSDPVNWNKAFLGSWIGEGLEVALKKHRPSVLIQQEFWVTLEGDQHTYSIPCHADVIEPAEGLVLDFKTKDGLVWVQRQVTADQGYQFQRHVYALGAWQSGVFGDLPLEQVRVGNIYYDRSGREAVPYVQIEPFDPEVIRQAVWWLEEVVAAHLANEEATKEPPRQVCEAACGFFTICRAFDTDVEGVLRDEETLDAIDAYLEGAEMEKAAKRLKNAAQIRLNGITGNTETHSLRWTLVNGSEVNYIREPYMRMSLVKRKKK